MPITRRLSGLYVLTDAELIGGARLLPAVAAALRGGARLVQYRDKSQNVARRKLEAEALRALCTAQGALLIINDDVELAAECGADGVHLGKDDADIQAARARLGPTAIIGMSCYNDLARAHAAQTAGADYLAFGSFYPSAIKPQAPRASLDLLRQARRELRLPLCAIGGITADNAQPLLTAGADLLAVINGVFASDNIEAAARGLTTIFTENKRFEN